MDREADRLVELPPGWDFPAAPICPACQWRECYVVGISGFGNQVSRLLCGMCRFEWDEVLMFRYRCRPEPRDDRGVLEPST
jgi:hypothetical protein